MSWKQPIDDQRIENIFGSDYACAALMVLLLRKARNEDMYESKTVNGKPYQLSRGQVIFSLNFFAKRLLRTVSGTRKCMLRLEEVHKVVTSERTLNYTIVTIKDYNSWVDMSHVTSNESNEEVTEKCMRSNIPKSVKNDKNVKSVESEKDFEEFWELYPVKTSKKKAKEIYIKIYSKEKHLEILKGLNKYINNHKYLEEKKKKDTRVFIPQYANPTTWLNQERWNDQYDNPVDNKPKIEIPIELQETFKEFKQIQQDMKSFQGTSQQIEEEYKKRGYYDKLNLLEKGGVHLD